MRLLAATGRVAFRGAGDEAARIPFVGVVTSVAERRRR